MCPFRRYRSVSLEDQLVVVGNLAVVEVPETVGLELDRFLGDAPPFLEPAVEGAKRRVVLTTAEGAASSKPVTTVRFHRLLTDQTPWILRSFGLFKRPQASRQPALAPRKVGVRRFSWLELACANWTVFALFDPRYDRPHNRVLSRVRTEIGGWSEFYLVAHFGQLLGQILEAVVERSAFAQQQDGVDLLLGHQPTFQSLFGGR